MDKVTRKKNTILKTTIQNEGETYKSLLKINKIKKTYQDTAALVLFLICNIQNIQRSANP